MLCYVSSPFLYKYCNKDCNWVGMPNSTPFKLWGFPNKKWEIKLNSFRLRERRELYNILVTTFNLDWHLETFAAAELYLFDRQLMIVLDIGNGHWRIIFQMDIHTYISVGDIGQIFHKWLLFLKPDIIVTVPEGRCCCSVPHVKYCWVAEVIYSSWVPEVRDSVELFPKLAIIVQFLKLEIVDKIRKLNRVVEFLISVRSKVLFIKALLAIVCCTAQ